jgi:hypothetical protein
MGTEDRGVIAQSVARAGPADAQGSKNAHVKNVMSHMTTGLSNEQKVLAATDYLSLLSHSQRKEVFASMGVTPKSDQSATSKKGGQRDEEDSDRGSWVAATRADFKGPPPDYWKVIDFDKAQRDKADAPEHRETSKLKVSRDDTKFPSGIPSCCGLVRCHASTMGSCRLYI